MNPQYISRNDSSDEELAKLREITVDSALNDATTLPKPILNKLMDKAINEKLWSDDDINNFNEMCIRDRGGTILFVGTKKQAQDALKTEAERCGMYLSLILIFELTDNEKKLIDEAISAGLKIYCMTVTVASDCLLKAARAFLVFKAVEELGQILVYLSLIHIYLQKKHKFTQIGYPHTAYECKESGGYAGG